MRSWIGAAAIAATALTAPAFGQNYSSFTVFGDSLSDNGNLFRLTGQPPAPYFQGRFSNGLTYAERLPGLLGIVYTPSTNFAVGGALTDTTHNAGLPNVGMQSQVNSFVASGRSLGSRDLVAVWGGANDYFATLNTVATQTTAQATTTISNQINRTVGNLSGQVTSLARIGGREFILPNLPLLGATPSVAANGATAVATANLITVNHNTTLAVSAASLGPSLGANIYLIDTAALFTDIQANPARYGLTNVTAACISTPSCVGGSAATQAQYLFWDGVHPTAAIHQIYAAYVAANLQGTAVLSTPGRLAEASARGFASDISARQVARRGGAGGASVSGSLLPGEAQSGSADKPFAVFAAFNYGWGDRDASSTEVKFDYRDTSFTVGADYRMSDQFLMGVALGYGASDAKLANGLGRIEQTSFRGAFYASYFSDNWYLDADVVAGSLDFDKIDRNTAFIGAPRLNAKTTGSMVGVGGEAGYLFKFGDLALGPLAGLRYASYGIDGYSENGFAGVARQVSTQSFSYTTARFGAQAAYRAKLDGAVLAPRVALALEQPLDSGARSLTSNILSQPGVSQTVRTANNDKTAVRLSIGLAAGLSDGYTISLDGDTRFGGDGQDSRVIGRLRVAF